MVGVVGMPACGPECMYVCAHACVRVRVSGYINQAARRKSITSFITMRYLFVSGEPSTSGHQSITGRINNRAR